MAKVSGEVTMEEIIGAISASVQDPAFQPGFDIISDHLEITQPITAEQVRGLSFHLKSLAASMAGSRWAVIVRTPASFGMMRMLSVYAEEVPMEVRVFETSEDAEEWLASPRD